MNVLLTLIPREVESDIMMLPKCSRRKIGTRQVNQSLNTGFVTI